MSDAQPPGPTSVRTIDLTEPGGQSPRVWAKRRATAENAVADLVKRFERHQYAVDAETIFTDSIRMLAQALVAEGRVSEELVRARVAHLLAEDTARTELDALQLLIGEFVGYRIVTSDEAVARLCEYQLRYLRPAFEQAVTRPRPPRATSEAAVTGGEPLPERRPNQALAEMLFRPARPVAPSQLAPTPIPLRRRSPRAH